jgi:hypothetical protein
MSGLRRWLARHGESSAFVVLLAYFAGRACYLAFHLAHHIPPDEIVHLRRVLLYARTAWLPADSPESYVLGVVGYQPYLYYFLMGKLLHANVFPITGLAFLRLANAALACALVFCGWRWVRLFSADTLVRLLFVVMLTNTLMFTVISSAVSYDTLVNLCGATSVYCLTRFFLRPRGGALLGLGLSLLAGALTKVTFLPLAAILLACLAVHERRRLAALPAALRSRPGFAGGVHAAAVAALLALLALNLALYGGNLIRFGRLVPVPSQVLTEQQLMQSPITARNSILARYRRGEIDYDTARMQASAIRLEVARRDTFDQLRADERKRIRGEVFEPYSRTAYALPWSWMMAQRTFGLLGHTVLFRGRAALSVYCGIVVLAMGVFAARLLTRRVPEDLELYAIAIVGGYTLVLMQLVNYPAHLSSQTMVMSLQGRYLFPVLIPFYGLVARYALGYWARPVQAVGFVAAAVWFVYGDLPFLLSARAAELFFAGSGG